MADQLGALPFPSDTFAEGVRSITDPLVDNVAAFLRAYINFALAVDWSRVAPGAGLPVRDVILTDTDRAWFHENSLPALFVFRHRARPEKIADELYRNVTQLHILWIPIPTSPEIRQTQAPMVNGVAAAIHEALLLGRHPSWVATGDEDADAAELGSVLMDRAGLSHPPMVVDINYNPKVKVTRGDGEPIDYWGALVTVECVELSSFDLALRGVPAAVNMTVTQATGTNAIQLIFQ